MLRLPKAAPTGGRETALTRLVGALALGPTQASSLAAGAAAVMTATLVIWALPWIPIGMTGGDYSPAVGIAVVLATGSAITGLVAAHTRSAAVGRMGLIDLWLSFLGKTMRVRNRQQFRTRLARECRRTRRDRRWSSILILVRVSQGDGGRGPATLGAFQHMTDTLSRTVRASDVMGIAGDNEIGVIAIGADARAGRIIRARLERTLSAASAQYAENNGPIAAPVISLGSGTLGADGTEPHVILAAARASMTPLAPTSEQAA